MKFCYIAPTSLLPTVEQIVVEQGGGDPTTHAHLLLAHLLDRQSAEFDQQYYNWYWNKDGLKILDNSAFELYKQGKEMFPTDKLIDIAMSVQARYIVLSDYPGQPGKLTIQAAEQFAPRVRSAGFGTFFVPQSRIGDIVDYINCFEWAANSPLVDYIGISILGVPNAYGVERGNKLQRYFSRTHMMYELQRRGILETAKFNNKKIHFLGMVDGPNEIQLVKQFGIDTWDSSAPVWTAANGIRFDRSPTGLINGKFEKHVDFSAKYDKLPVDMYEEFLGNLTHNIQHIINIVGN
jgi:hypothetical protein